MATRVTKTIRYASHQEWMAWAIFYRKALVVFDARCPVYWKRSVAEQAAEAHGLKGAAIVRIVLTVYGKVQP